MKIWVGVTDEDWFTRLGLLKPDEVNFWQPERVTDVSSDSIR
jgi:hypothetical protein